MADNVGYTPGAGSKVAARDVTYSGEAALAQAVGLVTFAGADDAKTATDVSTTNPMPVADANSGNVLLRILQMLMAPLGYDKSLSRQRGTVVVESGTIGAVTTVGTVTTATTVGTLNNISAIGGYSAQMQIIDANRAAWALSHRSRIT
jgi:hypothetical protein